MLSACCFGPRLPRSLCPPYHFPPSPSLFLYCASANAHLAVAEKNIFAVIKKSGPGSRRSTPQLSNPSDPSLSW
eukprot:1152303-Rhodomonas_salina.1